MVAQLTIEDILQKAIQKEIESQNLYAHLGRRMTDPAAKDTFASMVRAEKRHQELLEQYQRGDIVEGTLSSGQAVDYKLAEYFDQPEITPQMSLKDIFLLAANREKASHELYLGLANVHPPGRARRLLEELAGQELEHKRKVELMYTEVAFPQTDGG
ncbi:MAG: ferritin family protein [Chloroflexi bacterium]|nr:ferritin family protein [Chloroflexota bacterium]